MSISLRSKNKIGTYHEGELAVQELTGERDIAIMNGQVIDNKIPKGAVSFISQQNYCLLGIVNGLSEIWPIFISGDPGFAFVTDDEKTISISLEQNEESINNPFYKSLKNTENIGCLFIELSTRRRLRINGKIKSFSESELVIIVEQGYPNCPKYIQRRNLEESNQNTSFQKQEEGNKFTDDIKKWIKNADTFFVASASTDGSCDISHRGGKPGFIKIEEDILHIPDYPGNSMFNTLGNFYINPRAGLLFIDFENNRQLQITGDVNLDFNIEENKNQTGGTGRWWKFIGKKWVISSLDRSFKWNLVDSSPFNP